MNLSAPTFPVFIIAVVIAGLAVAGTFVAIPVISANAFWVAIVAFVVLVIGNVASGV